MDHCGWGDPTLGETSPTVCRGGIGRCQPLEVSGRVTDTDSTLCPRMPAGSRFRARDRQPFWTMTEALRPPGHRRAEQSKLAPRQPLPASTDTNPFAGTPPGTRATRASHGCPPPTRRNDGHVSSTPPQRHRTSRQVSRAEGAVRSRSRHPVGGDAEMDSTVLLLGVQSELVGFT